MAPIQARGTELRQVEIRLLSLPTKVPLAAAHDPHPAEDRLLTVLRVERFDGAVGWGECSALNRPGYTPEWAEDSYERLVGWSSGDRAEPDPAEVPLTAAAIEMALLDAELGTAGHSLAQHLGATAATVTAGATIGLHPVEESLAMVAELVAAGYRRVKVKVAPHQLDPVPHELSHAYDDLDVQVDGNGSLDERHMMDLLRLTEHGVTAIEQPFATDRADLAAEFRAVSITPVIADEAVRSLSDAEQVLDAGAADGVVIKPGPLGGVGPATELLRWLSERGAQATVGGMLECGLGRHALAAFAACDGFTLVGDLSPARRWLAVDPWPDLELVEGQIVVPSGFGVAPPPDPDVLDRVTVRRSERTS